MLSFIKYKQRRWDGRIRLMNGRSKTMPYGLMNRLKNYCKFRDYLFESDFQHELADFTREDALSFISELKMPFEIRDYQLDAFVHAIRKQRSVLVSPTASGKSAIIYLMMRLFYELNRKVLMIVHTVNLVTQMKQDFEDYAVNLESLPVQEVCRKVERD